ncbi:BTAD domain-containing putative transcriptional regulator [Actinoplanes sp. NPDC049265]|uniref:AfsR/SARP family transcriptional regulator n=1 Tax=Actinoplanes sp. NPDC049265 TaxID=3363902 RepID=UPI003711A81E
MWRDGEEIDLGPRQRRTMLALLLARARQTASLSELVEILWDDEPPAHAVNLVHRHVGRLRRQCEPDLPNRASGRWLVPRGGGYGMAVDVESLDLLRFRGLAEWARGETPAEALALYARALSWWKGPVAADLEPIQRAHPAFTAIEREYSAVVEAFAQAALTLGQGRVALPALAEAADRHPYDEATQAWLLLVLAATGRQGDAVARYELVTRRLREELGVDPGAELRQAYEQVLRQQFPSAGLVRAAPAQLPPDLPFTGRRDLLAQVRGPVMAIHGMPGTGKTALAVRAAHRLADRYPDGQLYLDLHGFDHTRPAVTTDEALHDLLVGLGVDARAIPSTRQARTGLYRSLLAGKRMLVVLDDARDADQVADLLPGTDRSLALVTGRSKLTKLRAAAGADFLPVGLPSPAEARAQLRIHLGPGRAAADPAALDAVVEHCGRLPLALALTGARAAAQPELSLADLADELRRMIENPDRYAHSEIAAGLRAAFAGSYRRLSEPAARLFHLLSHHPGDEVTVAVAERLGDLPPATAHALLAELDRAGLVLERDTGRYSWHRFARMYAAGTYRRETVGSSGPK